MESVFRRVGPLTAILAAAAMSAACGGGGGGGGKVDLGSDRVWILDRATGAFVGGIGRPGHMAGEFTFPHTATLDSKGNLYVAETVGGRRHQKFLKVGD